MVDRLPGARVISACLWGILLAGLGFEAARYFEPLPVVQRTETKVTLSILRSEWLAFLVTRRTTTQVVVEHDESDWFGEWRGIYWCTVTWRWGIDLQNLTEKDIRREGGTVIIHLPDPELLDFATSPGTAGFMSKSTMVPKLMDFCRGGWQRDVLEREIHAQAMKFAVDQGLLPSRDEIVRQLDEASKTLSQAMGVELKFE